jgi:hypothetical protein
MGFAATSKYGSRPFKNLIMNGEQTHGRVAEFARGPDRPVKLERGGMMPLRHTQTAIIMVPPAMEGDLVTLYSQVN